MTMKPKCSQCNEREVFSKGLCSGCYGRNWREARKAERAAAIAEQFPPKQLTSGPTSADLEPVIVEGEIVHDEPPTVSDPHLIALSPSEMDAARGNMKAHLEAKLVAIEREIVECNAALNEARRNGWSTTALTMARNRAVDDETYFNKILCAVEAGHTIIPDFPIEVFAVRRGRPDKRESHTWTGPVNPQTTWLNQRQVVPDCAPAGAGEYRNPKPEVYTFRSPARKDQNGKDYVPFTITRTGGPIGPIVFPAVTARSPIMKAAAQAMAEKTFDQVGVCLPVKPDSSTRRVQEQAGRAGDPLVIGQILRKKVGNHQKCVSFIIAWYLNLNDL